MDNAPTFLIPSWPSDLSGAAVPVPHQVDLDGLPRTDFNGVCVEIGIVIVCGRTIVPKPDCNVLNGKAPIVHKKHSATRHWDSFRSHMRQPSTAMPILAAL